MLFAPEVDTLEEKGAAADQDRVEERTDLATGALLHQSYGGNTASYDPTEDFQQKTMLLAERAREKIHRLQKLVERYKMRQRENTVTEECQNYTEKSEQAIAFSCLSDLRQLYDLHVRAREQQNLKEATTVNVAADKKPESMYDPKT